MSLTENSEQVFSSLGGGGCNRTQNLRFGPYTNNDGIICCKTPFKGLSLINDNSYTI